MKGRGRWLMFPGRGSDGRFRNVTPTEGVQVMSSKAQTCILNVEHLHTSFGVHRNQRRSDMCFKEEGRVGR